MALSPTPGIWTIAGGAGRCGLFPERVRFLPNAPRQLRARGALQASVVFDDHDRAFVADMAGWVQAFAPNGETSWRCELTGGISASPAVDVESGRLFVGTHAGWVYALRSRNGTVLWRKQPAIQGDTRILSSLLYLPAQQRIVLSCWSGKFYALDANSGEIECSWDAGLWPQAGATADDQGNVYCVRAVRGKGLAFFRVSCDGQETVLHRQAESRRGAYRTIVAASPVVDRSRGVAYFVLNGDRSSEVHAWSLHEDRHLWGRNLPATVAATPSLGLTGCLFLADLQGALNAVEPDGSLGFRYASGTDYLLQGSVSDAGHQTFLGDPIGRLHLVARTGTGGPIFEASRSIQAQPSFDRYGNLYLPSTDRVVYVFRNLTSG